MNLDAPGCGRAHERQATGVGHQLRLATVSFPASLEHPPVGNGVLAASYIARTEAHAGTELSRFMTDGFDFGIGTLYPFLGKTEQDKRIMINSLLSVTKQLVAPRWIIDSASGQRSP